MSNVSVWSPGERFHIRGLELTLSCGKSKRKSYQDSVRAIVHEMPKKIAPTFQNTDERAEE